MGRVGITLQLCLAAVLLTGATAWWDHGHLLVAAVARQQLNETEAKVFEDILSKWNDDYPGFGDLISAASWPDHIKCNKHAPYCEGLKAYDSLTMFNYWHYTTVPFNPQNMKTLPAAASLKVDRSAAHCRLSEIERSFTEGRGYLIPNCAFTTASPNTDADAKFGTWVSWNIQLRYFLHIHSDLHQPCHCITTYTARYKNGDVGCNLVKLLEQDTPNLHSFWDSAAGLYTKSYPNQLSIADAKAEASKLITKYPPSTFSKEVIDNKNYWNLVEESHKLAEDVIMSELFSKTGGDQWLDWGKKGNSTKYTPSAAYITKAKELTQKQITLGGYRLAFELKKFYPYAKKFLDRKNAARTLKGVAPDISA